MYNFSKLAAMCNKAEANEALKVLFSIPSLSMIAITYLLGILYAYWVFYINTWFPMFFIVLQFISFIPATLSGIDFVKGVMILKNKVNS